MGLFRRRSTRTRKFLIILTLLLATFSILRPVSAQTAPSPPPKTASAQASQITYVVIKPVANMYSKASLESDVVSQAIYGITAVRLNSQHGWVDIRTPDHYTGWMQAAAVRKQKGHAYASGDGVLRVAQLSANIYREPDVTKHAPLLTLPWESRLELLPGKVEDGDRWLKVRLATDMLAYVQSGDVSSDFAPLSIDQTISVAQKFLGVTYTWGGSSDFGFDCSGFTQMLMRQRGIIMPRDADLQAAWSGVTPVERKDLQPGDLLFFGSAPDHITHTGMYIGNGQFIHDTTHSHPGVQISVLDDKPWTTLLVAARRAKS